MAFCPSLLTGKVRECFAEKSGRSRTFSACEARQGSDALPDKGRWQRAERFMAERIDKQTVFWYPVSGLLHAGIVWRGSVTRMSWCGAMAAQLICNQWVAGSTPVTSSKKNRLDSLESRRFFAFFGSAGAISAQTKKLSVISHAELLIQKWGYFRVPSRI